MLLELTAPPVSKQPRVKKSKLKYAIGDFIKSSEKCYQILGLNEAYETYLVQDLMLGTEQIIGVENLRKFKPTKKILDEFEFLRNRRYFSSYIEQTKLSPLVVFPSEENVRLLENATEIGFDIETYGDSKKFDAISPEHGQIRLLQAYLPQIDKTIVWDTGDMQNSKPLSDLLGIDILLKKLYSENCRVFIHNANFESLWIGAKCQRPINNIVDSMLLAQLYWAGLSRGFNARGVKNPNSLEQVALRLLGIKPDKTEQQFDYGLPLGNKQLNYAALDAKLTYQCGIKLLEMCEADGLQKVMKAELSAIPAFAMMNFKGIPVCRVTLEALKIEYQKAADKAILPWLCLFPGTNPGSPKQVLQCLKSKWGLNTFATDNATLTSFALENPTIDGLLFWRSLTKDIEYIDQYLSHIQTVNGFDVIRPNYRQNANNATGRSSSSKPNMQNIPTLTPKRAAIGLKPIRSAFKAPPGYKMIVVDLAASHAQIARYVSQDKKLREANESGIKLHFYTVQGMLEMEGKRASLAELVQAKSDKNHPLYPDISRLYAPSKTVFYGGLNLNGAATLQASFLKKADMPLSLDVCKQYIDGGRKAYAGLFKFQLSLIEKANSFRNARQFQYNDESEKPYTVGVFKGYYGTARSLDGGRLFIEKLPSKYRPGEISVKGTDAISYMWLRTEGTIMKTAIAQITKYIRNNKINGWLCQMTHDEVGIIVREEQALSLAQTTLNIVTESFRSLIPDYQPEDLDPKNYICNDWSEK